MFNSHFGESVWKQIIRDTVDGVSLDDTAKALDISHDAIFNMRHKVLLALEDDTETNQTTLSGVCEIYDTYVEVYRGRIDKRTLVLCDGEKSYLVLEEECGCDIGIVNGGKGNDSFYHNNNANGFHSFIKERHNGYRGIATKYLNRYNALFSKLYRTDEDVVKDIYKILLSNRENVSHTVEEVKTACLLDI